MNFILFASVYLLTLASTATVEQCQAVVNSYNIIPGVNWGVGQGKSTWDSMECTPVLCQYWASNYKINPLINENGLPSQLKPSWDGLQCVQFVGPYNANQCGAFSDKFNAYPYISWGSTPTFVKSHWQKSGCSQSLCLYWRQEYSIIPYVSWGTFPDDSRRKSWISSEMKCSLNSGSLSQSECATFGATYNVIPYVNKGSSSEDGFLLFKSSNCYTSMCNYWATEYGLKSPSDASTMLPADIQSSWFNSNMQCATIVAWANPSSSESVTPVTSTTTLSSSETEKSLGDTFSSTPTSITPAKKHHHKKKHPVHNLPSTNSIVVHPLEYNPLPNSQSYAAPIAPCPETQISPILTPGTYSSALPVQVHSQVMPTIASDPAILPATYSPPNAYAYSSTSPVSTNPGIYSTPQSQSLPEMGNLLSSDCRINISWGIWLSPLLVLLF